MRQVRVPTRTGKPRKWEGIFQSGEMSRNFEQTGKVGENHTKYWNVRDFRHVIFIIFSDIQMNCVLFAKMYHFFVKKIKHLKNTVKMEKITGKVREFCQSRKMGTM